VIIDKETKETKLWGGDSSTGLTTSSDGLYHPISSASFLTAYGATQIEMKYKED
jgi:hypothetical protein